MQDAVAISVPYNDKGTLVNKVDVVDYTVSTYDSKPHKVLLLDTSTDHKWITYLTESSLEDGKEALNSEDNALLAETTKRHYLTVRSFHETQQHTGSYAISLDVTDVIKLNHNKSNCISISADGRRVALSSFTQDHIYTYEEDSCKVFEFAESYTHLIKIKKLDFDCRAFFIDNGDLVLAQHGYWEIFDTNYSKKFDVDLRKDDIQLYQLDYLSHFTSILPPINERNYDECEDTAIKVVNNIIYTTRIAQLNIILTSSLKTNQIWSLTDRGSLLASIKAEIQENIFTFSDDGRFFATYSNLTTLFTIYNVKSSLKTSELKSQIDLKTGYIVTFAHFYNEDKYLAVAGILTDNDTKKTYATFEVWHIESEISIYYVSKEIKLGKRENRTIYPFIFEKASHNGLSDGSTINDQGRDVTEVVSITSNSKAASNGASSSEHLNKAQPVSDLDDKNVTQIRKEPSRLMAYYATCDDNGDIRSEVLELDIFQEVSVQEYKDYNEWKNAVDIDGSSDSGWYRLKEPINFCLQNTDVEVTGFKAICFVRKFENHLCYLRFDSNTIQMWKLSLATFHEQTGILDTDQLLFVYAYKAPLNAKFNPAPSYRIDFQDINQALPCLSFVVSPKDTSRILVNTTYIPQPPTQPHLLQPHAQPKKQNQQQTFYTEELFLPSNPLDWTEENQEIHSKLEHQYLKGACQALKYYTQVSTRLNLTKATKDDLKQIIQKIKYNIKSLLRKMEARNSAYFTSMSGSKILFLLTAFKEGHEIIYQILRTDQLPVNVFPGGRLINDDGTLDNNNSLTALIDKKNYQLYNLLLNRLIFYAKTQGIGGLSVITDALIRLQDNQQRDVLLKSCTKISFLCVEDAILPVAGMDVLLQKITFEQRNLSNFRNLDTFSYTEELISTKGDFVNQFVYFADTAVFLLNEFIKGKLVQLSNFIAATSPSIFKSIYNGIHNFIQKEIRSYRPTVPVDFVKLCVVPLVQFNSYYVYPEDRELIDQNRALESKAVEKKDRKFGKKSVFTRTATNIGDNSIFIEGDTVMEILLQYKWKQFAFWRFVIVCIIYLLYYITYSVGVSFAGPAFGYVLGSPITDKGHLACIILQFICAGIMLFQELHQLKRVDGYINYVLSPYNWVDLAAIVLPTLMFVAMYENHDYFDELNSFTALVLWLHGILRMRVWRFIGISLETIIQLALSVKEIVLIMVLIICAFTNAYWVLLINKEDAYFQEQYGGTVNIAGQDAPSEITFNDVTAGNPFGDVFKSFAAVWFFIFGVWDPVTGGDAGDNNYIIVLLIIFSLIAVLIFFNLVIVYMSSKIEEIMGVGTKAWIRHFASVVAEIEELWCFPHERHDRKKHPSFIFYYAHIDNIEEQEEFLQNDTEEIIQKLDTVYNFSADDDDEKLPVVVNTEKSYNEVQLNYSAKLVDHLKKSNELIIEKLNISELNPNQDLNRLRSEIHKLSSLMQDELENLNQVFNDS